MVIILCANAHSETFVIGAGSRICYWLGICLYGDRTHCIEPLGSMGCAGQELAGKCFLNYKSTLNVESLSHALCRWLCFTHQLSKWRLPWPEKICSSAQLQHTCDMVQRSLAEVWTSVVIEGWGSRDETEGYSLYFLCFSFVRVSFLPRKKITCVDLVVEKWITDSCLL